MTSSAPVEVRDLHKSFEIRSKGSIGVVPVLAGITFRVEQGEFLSIVGPTGCGKSTLLRIIAGLAAPTAGEVVTGAEGSSAGRPEIGMVFQTPALLPWLRVQANILFPATLRSRDTRSYGSRLEHLLRLVRLEDFARAYPHQLSLGMQQKVSLCRALIRRPELLLMDEPFSALDPLTRERFDVELDRIWSDERVTSLFVTHSITEALFLSDRVLVLTDRPTRIAALISTDFERPRNLAILHSQHFSDCEKAVREALNMT